MCLRRHMHSSNCCLFYYIFYFFSEGRIVCENEQINLQCLNELVLNINFAMYGRLAPSESICFYQAHFDQNCTAPTSLEIVKERCQGRDTCSIRAANDVFGDPCPFTTKYIHVKYSCEGMIVS